MNWVLQILCIYVLIVEILCNSSIFSQVPQVLDIADGSQATLTCILKDEYIKNYTISWLQNGKTIVQDETRYQVPSGLYIVQVNRQRDVGEFQCKAINRMTQSDVKLTPPVHINIKWILPGAVLLKSPSISALPLLPKMQVTLKCNITGNPPIKTRDISWYKNKVLIPSPFKDSDKELDPRISFKGERLIIRNLTLKDYDGQYSCCAAPTYGTTCSTRFYEIKVRDVRVPLLVEAPKDQIVLSNTEARFKCKFEAEPPPSDIRWESSHVDGFLPAKPSSDENCKYCIERDGSLLIKSVRDRFLGTYTCSTTGVNGDIASGSAELKLAFLNQFEEDHVQKYVRPGLNKEYVCHPPDGQPTVNITWYRNGKPIDVHEIKGSNRVAVSVHTLIFDKPQASDEGIYKCVAKNIFGQVIKVYNITLTVDPVIRTGLKDQSLNEGDDIKFTCDATGVPKPIIQWTKNGVTIIQDDTHVLIDNTLSITNVGLDDSARYECTATNPETQRKADSSAELSVIELMKLDPKPVDTCIEKGSKHTIKCGVRGADKPSVNWDFSDVKRKVKSKQDSELQNTVNLIFSNASLNDQGQYTCIASDSDRELKQTIKITVQSRPVIKVKPKNITEFEGENIKLRCSVGKSSNLTVTWYVNSALDNGKYTYNGVDYNNPHIKVEQDGSLTILQTELPDTGWYTCSYTNCDITVRAAAYVTIADKYIEPKESPDDQMHKKVQTIAFAVGSAVAYVLITLTVVIYCRRKKKSKKDKTCSDENGDEDRIMLNGFPQSNGSTKSNGEIPMSVLSKLDPAIEQYMYDVNSLDVVASIGKGEFGKVFLSKAPGLLPELDDDILVMVKQLDTTDITDSSAIDNVQAHFNREVALLSMAKHDNIVSLLGICCSEDFSKPSHLITEYLEWGILKLCLQASNDGKIGKFNKHIMMSICCQLASALEHLTKLNITHRDVAARNCVISSKLTIKLSLLSLSKEGFEKEYYKLEDRCIPLRWSSPEAIHGNYSTKTDIWSFGITCWEVFTLGRLPFEEIPDKELYDAMSSEPPTLPQLNNSKRITSLISKCCQTSPSLRPEFYQIVRKLQSIISTNNTGAAVLEDILPINEDNTSEAGPLITVTEADDAQRRGKNIA